MKLVISTSALIGRSPIAASRRCSHSGLGPFLTPRTRRSAKPRHNDGVVPKSSRTGAGTLHRLYRNVLQCAHVGSGEVARDAVDAGAIRPVRRQVDLDDGIVEM